MFSCVAFLGLFCAVSAQLHGECHSNVHQLREDEVITSVVHLMDRNHDDHITAGELVVGFAEVLGYQFHTPIEQILAMNAFDLVKLAGEYMIIIDRQHFVQKWHERFGDSVPFVRATFDAYDENKDGELSVMEIENIRIHALDRADNGDGVLTAEEFRSYLKFVYSC